MMLPWILPPLRSDTKLEVDLSCGFETECPYEYPTAIQSRKPSTDTY